MTRARILLATYNGARFLEPLLASLRAQNHPRFDVVARDDGSSDSTCEVLGVHARRGELTVRSAPHAGVMASFFDLLTSDAGAADHVAFCDQDDVWHPDKLSRACAALDRHPATVPVLYCGRTRIVDEHLRVIALSRIPRRAPCLENALVENVATGCTIVMNRAARDLVVGRLPTGAVMHDWWCYLTIAALGVVVFDPDPKVDYRQHAGNLIGAAPDFTRRWMRRFRPLRQNLREGPRFQQAGELLRLFGHALPASRLAVLERFLEHRRSWRAAWVYARHPDVFRQARLDDVILRLMLGLRLV